ncbi:MAG: arginyltransferase [Polyangiaceae bacterium]|nr:arginyltransferase [Polyangiaceae bacterium]
MENVSYSRRLPVLLPGDPPEFLVHDELEPCPYLTDRKARLPFRVPVRSLLGHELDRRLAEGDRRNGPLLYRPSCPDCNACEPIRLDVERFAPRERHRRVLRRGDASLRTEMGPALVTDERVALYNTHLEGRGLRNGGAPMDRDGYAHFLTESCCSSFELRYYAGDRLVGIAVTDRGQEALSAVYCFYDPAFGRFSPGTYSILKQLELCRSWGFRYLYLGLHVQGSSVMAYKSRFLPHERLLGGEWVEITEPSADAPTEP